MTKQFGFNCELDDNYRILYCSDSLYLLQSSSCDKCQFTFILGECKQEKWTRNEDVESEIEVFLINDKITKLNQNLQLGRKYVKSNKHL